MIRFDNIMPITERPHSPPARQSGFSLLEIMVVMLLIALTAGFVGMTMRHDSGAVAESEARRFAALVRQLCQESLMQGRWMAVEFLADRGYRFLVDGDEGWTVITGDDLFRQRALAEPAQLDPGPAGSAPRCSPDGAIDRFRVVFHAGESRFLVHSGEDQDIKVASATTRD